MGHNLYNVIIDKLNNQKIEVIIFYSIGRISIQQNWKDICLEILKRSFLGKAISKLNTW